MDENISNEKKEEIVSQEAVVLPVEDTLILPGTTAYVYLARTARGLLEEMQENPLEPHLALPLKDGADPRSAENFHRIGVTFTYKSVEESNNGFLVEILAGTRVEVTDISYTKDNITASYTFYPTINDLDARQESEMLSYLKDIVKNISSHFQGADDYLKFMDNIHSVSQMISWLARFTPMSADEKYELLKTDSDRDRALHFMDVLIKQRESLDWNISINERMSERTNKYYRKQMLKEQMAAIQKELNEDDGDSEDGEAGGKRRKKKDYRERIAEARLPEEIENAALDELDRLNDQPEGSAETSVIRNYLDFILALPWHLEEGEKPDLKNAEKILNDDHYGLEKVKKRILEHLAVMQLRGDNKGSILLLVGPPGTGKTSLGKSIAKALNRKYVRLSLGGIRDESEIRGHRRTYVGALPGRILNGIKQAGTMNPVMVLDEVDKIQEGGFSGDPSSALLEVLDPEQNNTFTDHYLDLPYDLSNVFFIATANTTETIPAPLLDRMEVIEISSYTEAEKFHIAKEHLIPQVLEETGLKEGDLTIDDEALKSIISDYTMEGGVRNLKKRIQQIARHTASDEVTGKTSLPVEVKKDDLSKLLERKTNFHDKVEASNPPGVITGLAWTQVGGEILFIEAADMPGSGQLILTGQLGDVMKESAQIALSLIKSRLPIDAEKYKDRDIHIHVPEGSVPKDGPSAGIALSTALASLFTGKAVDSHIAMTGEITLRGKVMPIGGLKEKLLAANRAGITKALIPRENMQDLKDLPEEVRSALTIVPVDTIEDVLKETIGEVLPPPKPFFPGEFKAETPKNMPLPGDPLKRPQTLA